MKKWIRKYSPAYLSKREEDSPPDVPVSCPPSREMARDGFDSTSANVADVLVYLQCRVAEYEATKIATRAARRAAHGSHVTGDAQKNAELETHLAEKFFLLTLEGVRTKEQFISYIHNGNTAWRASMARCLIKKASVEI